MGVADVDGGEGEDDSRDEDVAETEVAQEDVGGGEERTRGKGAECQRCGRVLSYTDMARHRRSCWVCDPGGGPTS